MITINTAIESARLFAKEILQESSTCRQTLEEVELSADGESWQVMLGMDNGPFGIEHKVITVRAKDGEVIGMKNHKAPGAA